MEHNENFMQTNPALPTGPERGNKRRRRRRPLPDDIVARKLQWAANPYSVVFMPRTTEAWAMTRILLEFDRFLHFVRVRAGTYIPADTAVDIMQQTQEFVQDLEKLTTEIVGLFDQPKLFLCEATPPADTIHQLVQRADCIVFLPRTTEGQRIALAIKRLDSAMFQLRTHTSFLHHSDWVQQVLNLIRRFYWLFHTAAEQVGFRLKSLHIGSIFREAPEE